MRRSAYFKLFILFLFILTILVGYDLIHTSGDSFDIEQFQSEIRSRNFSFEMIDAGHDFFPTPGKRMSIENEVLGIYIFKNNEEMEKESKLIKSDGFGYDNGSKFISVSWVAPPHFFKKGNIIVQYIGYNEKIISTLKDIFGEQFAGDTS